MMGKKPIRLARNSSSYGIGAIISHVMEDGKERPIELASRTLNDSERNYPQVEKEALSLIFGVKKFYKYLYGRRFLLMTDHKPITTILGPKRGLPTLGGSNTAKVVFTCQVINMIFNTIVPRIMQTVIYFHVYQ
jgi:hypothetical protein